MLFDENVIKNIGDDVLSAEERRYLQDKYFPKSPPSTWQNDLKEKWEKSKKDALENDQTEKRWSVYTGQRVYSGQRLFRVTHEELVNRARRFRPKSAGYRVTDFTGWIYSLYRGSPTRAELDHGKAVEKQIQFRVGQIKAISKWELIFQDPLEGVPEAKTISSLTINGKPMVGVPDVVFREKETGRILIVERKASNADVPSDGWPNLRAQLWAYSQIDEWKNSPEILLAGEVWGQYMREISISRIIQWSAGSVEFDEKNRELFEIYASWCRLLGDAA